MKKLKNYLFIFICIIFVFNENKAEIGKIINQTPHPIGVIINKKFSKQIQTKINPEESFEFNFGTIKYINSLQIYQFAYYGNKKENEPYVRTEKKWSERRWNIKPEKKLTKFIVTGGYEKNINLNNPSNATQNGRLYIEIK